MYNMQQGKACSGMLNGVLNGVRNVDRRPSDIHRRGDTVGLWLRRGRLSVWAAGGGMLGMGRHVPSHRGDGRRRREILMDKGNIGNLGTWA